MVAMWVEKRISGNNQIEQESKWERSHFENDRDKGRERQAVYRIRRGSPS